MARTKGMLNLSGNLEVNAQAPLDARTIVPTEADLTVANNFPYPYIGLEVYVTGTGKKFRLVNLDTTQSSSWHEVGEGGGGSGLPSGGTAGQYLVKQSATEGDADWQSLNTFTGATSQAAGAAGLVPAPAIGDDSKVLFGNGSWGNIVMPSVDYSQQSVEANILSTIEKVVGQNTNGKLLYQRTIDIGALPASSSQDQYTKIANLGVYDYFKIVDAQGVQGTAGTNLAVFPLPIVQGRWENPSTVLYSHSIWIEEREDGTYISTRNTRADFTHCYVTIQYTKTTDSPLASDEKFAGLTASGEVIYKKQLTASNIAIVADTDVSVSHGINNIGQLCKCSIYGKIFDTTNYPSGVVLNQKKSTYCDATNLHFKTDSSWAANANTIWYITIYYTKTS